MHRSLKNKIPHGKGTIKKSTSVPSITSFLGHDVPVLSEWNVDLRLEKNHPPIPFKIFIIPDIVGSPSFLQY